MLAVALCADAGPERDGNQLGRFTLPSWATGSARNGMTSLLPSRMPKRAYAHVSQLNGDRLAATTHELLLSHPAEIIGAGVEVMELQFDCAIWHRLEPATKLPRGIAATGRVHFWAAMHSRRINDNGTQAYHSTLVPFSRSGLPLAAHRNGGWICTPHDAGKEAIVACSLAEDATRPTALLASVTESVELIFPVDATAYLEAFALRDRTANEVDRRRALLHWVSKHLRHTRKGPRDVKRHMRGAHEFSISGLRVKLWSADSAAPIKAAFQRNMVSA
jgi:hypothetical protein